jgi:hypothetical protein
MNYYRIPLHEKLKIEKEYSEQQLKAFTEKMLRKTNELQLKITKNDSVAVVIPYSDEEIYNLALKGYTNLPTDLKEFLSIQLNKKCTIKEFNNYLRTHLLKREKYHMSTYSKEYALNKDNKYFS